MNHLDPDLDRPSEECGVIGISTPLAASLIGAAGYLNLPEGGKSTLQVQQGSTRGVERAIGIAARHLVHRNRLDPAGLPGRAEPLEAVLGDAVAVGRDDVDTGVDVGDVPGLQNFHVLIDPLFDVAVDDR